MKHLKNTKPIYFLYLILLLSFTNCKKEQKNTEKETTVTEKEVLPNIIWFVAEDQSPDFFPMYGDNTISLPNIESLSSNGVVFNNAYAPVPVCAPARSAIITGMYPTTLGTHNMRTYTPWNTDNQKQIGIHSYSPIVPEGTVMFTQLMREKGYYCSNNAKEDYNFEKLKSAWDDSGKKAHWRNRKEGQPFFAVFNYEVCHESGIWKEGKSELLVSPDSVPVPPYFPDTKITRHDLAVNYSNLKRMDDKIGELIQQLKDDGLYENSIIFFYGDHGGPFPRYKRSLYETGLKVPMVIKYAKNKKENNTDDRFLSFIDLAPSVLSLAGIKPPEVMQGKALLGKYKVDKSPEYVFSTSDRFDGYYDRIRAVRSSRYKYIKNFNTEISNALPIKYRKQIPMMQEMEKMYANGKLNAVQSQWFNTPKPSEELYDLQEDPHELSNLAGNTKLQDTLVHLRTVLVNWSKETNDLGGVPEKELMAKWLIDGQQPKLNPLEIVKKDGEVTLKSELNDATILWKQPKDSLWNIYSKPLASDISIEAKAERIGYTDSAVLEYSK